MFEATCHLKSASPYAQGKKIVEEKPERMTHQDFEKKSWRQRMHVEDGKVIIPPLAFKNCLAEAAKYKSIQIPGKGKSTYTKHFESAILVLDPLRLEIESEEVQGTWMFVPADGKRGGSRRVDKCFPVIKGWEGIVKFFIFDEIITEEVFTNHIIDAGRFIGIGSFRPRNNGIWGRFSVEDIKWQQAA